MRNLRGAAVGGADLGGEEEDTRVMVFPSRDGDDFSDCRGHFKNDFSVQVLVLPSKIVL